MNNKRGSILVVTLGFVLIFTLFGLGSMYLSTMQNEAAEKWTASNKAFWLAEAGIQKALWEFKENNCINFHQHDVSAAGQCNNSVTPACVSCTDCGNKEKCLSSLSSDSLSAYGDYDIVMDNFNSRVTSTGSYPNRTAANPTQRKVQIDSDSPYKYAFFAKDNIGTASPTQPGIDNNSCTDSYTWPAVLTTPGSCSGGNSTSTGGIGTLGTAGTVIKINNGVNIHGGVSTGPGGTVSNSGTIWVLPITNTNTGTLPSVNVSSEEPALTSMSPTGITLDGTGTIDLGANGIVCYNSGTYIGGICYYKYQNIDLSHPNTTLRFHGPVRLYLTGYRPSDPPSSRVAVQVSSGFSFVLMSGAIVKMYTAGKVILTNNGEVNSQNDKKPADFEIRSTYNFTNGGVQVANGGSFYGIVYAPDTDLTVGKNGGGTIFYGAMVGKTIHVNNNTPQHFENGLAGSITDTISKWREL